LIEFITGHIFLLYTQYMYKYMYYILPDVFPKRCKYFINKRMTWHKYIYMYYINWLNECAMNVVWFKTGYIKRDHTTYFFKWLKLQCGDTVSPYMGLIWKEICMYLQVSYLVYNLILYSVRNEDLNCKAVFLLISYCGIWLFS